jgi:hypothetical protein
MSVICIPVASRKLVPTLINFSIPRISPPRHNPLHICKTEFNSSKMDRVQLTLKGLSFPLEGKLLSAPHWVDFSQTGINLKLVSRRGVHNSWNVSYIAAHSACLAYSLFLKMETLRSSETSLQFRHATWLHVSERVIVLITTVRISILETYLSPSSG